MCGVVWCGLCFTWEGIEVFSKSKDTSVLLVRDISPSSGFLVPVQFPSAATESRRCLFRGNVSLRFCQHFVPRLASGQPSCLETLN